MARRVIGRIIVDGTDHEWWPAPDELIHSEFSVERVLDSRTPSLNIEELRVEWGGECRVEVNITGGLVDHGNVQIKVVARFYEGTSVRTEDLEDIKNIDFVVRRGGSPVHRRIHLRNEETGGGDYANVAVSFTNTLVEE